MDLYMMHTTQYFFFLKTRKMDLCLFNLDMYQVIWKLNFKELSTNGGISDLIYFTFKLNELFLQSILTLNTAV